MVPDLSLFVQEQLIPYDQVFINFRGEDLRYNFVSYLVRALITAGINAFIDSHEPRGRDLTVLFRRIEESKIVLVVFSKRYMESEWCMEELVRISECVDENKLVAIPIFFKVEPDELEKLLDEACQKLAIAPETRIVNKWKVALKFITNKMGLTFKEKSDEAKFVKEIVEKVKETLNTIKREELEMANPPGRAQRIKQVEEKLSFDRDDETRFVGIVGMPGIGKTTLVTELFNENRSKFCRCVNFLKIRDMLKTVGHERLRKLFLQELLQDTDIPICDETTHDSLKVKEELCTMKVFVVLEDVSSMKDIKFLLGNQDWIKKGSRIVITTRDRAFITELDPNPYVVPRLNREDAVEYFSFYAFQDGKCNPEMGDFMKMSREFVDYGIGNPLALKILGRELRGKDVTYWEKTLRTLAKSPNKSIQNLLKISFDELDEKEKDAFLDIACFFRSEDEYYVRSLLDLEDSESSVAAPVITDLAYKFLISISGGSIEMHDLLHSFAMELCSIASAETQQNKKEPTAAPPANELRLWNHNNIIAALQKKMDIENVRGISLDMSEVPYMALKRFVFNKMRKLRYLKFYNSTCSRECGGDCKLNLPDGLSLPLEEVRYLDWLKFPLKRLPSEFNPKDLVDLRLLYSKIEQVWKVPKKTPKLKWVDLSNSRMLKTFSGFSMAPNLLRLNLEGCTSLDGLSTEMQTMESLVFLNLRGCTSLRRLPKMNIPSLKTLILSNCSKLSNFQVISESLESLYLDGTAIYDLPSDFENLQRLVLLNLKECRRLESLPKCIGKLKALQELILSDCSDFESFSDIEDNMENLRVLLLDGTSVVEGPKILHGVNSLSFLQRLSLSRNDVIISLGSEISELYHLKWLDLKDCKKLRSIAILPQNLRCLDAHGCIMLETVMSPLAFTMRTEEINTMFIFTNCFKLNDIAKNEIASHFRRKCQMISDDHHNEIFVSRALIGTCYPGYEVPPWFSHEAYGSELEPNLPPHWCNNKFLGIALCVIVSFRDYTEKKHRLLAKCTCEFANLNASCSRFNVPIGGWFETGNEKRTIESDHVFIGYVSWLNIKKQQEEAFKKICGPTKATLKFQVIDEGTGEVISQCEVVKCGFGLVYEPNDEVSNVVSSVATTRMNGEVEEPTYLSKEESSDQPIASPTTAGSNSENSSSSGSFSS